MALGTGYDAIFGLGYWCGPAHNIRQLFRTSAAYPLDWWVVHYDALIRLFEQDFQGLFDPDQLEIRQELEGVMCRRYRTLHPHDFARDAKNQFLPALEPQVAGLRQKYTHLIARMDATVVNRRVLCVRQWLRAFPEEDVDEPTAIARATHLHGLLAARWPTASVDLLVVDGAPRAMEHRTPYGRIAFDLLGDAPEPGHWKPLAWRGIMDRQGVSLVRARAA